MSIFVICGYFFNLFAKNNIVAYSCWLVANLIGLATTNMKLYFTITTLFSLYGLLINLRDKYGKLF